MEAVSERCEVGKQYISHQLRTSEQGKVDSIYAHWQSYCADVCGGSQQRRALFFMSAIRPSDPTGQTSEDTASSIQRDDGIGFF